MDPTDTYGLRDTQPRGSFISEGDTPTFMNLLDNGLRAWENAGYAGGWGGIRRPANAPGGFGRGAPVVPVGPDDPGIGLGIAPARSDANKTAVVPAAPPAGGGGGRGGQPIPPRTAAVSARFFAAAQNDFTARLKWSVTPKFSDANHPPKVSVRGPLEVSAAHGSTAHLQANVSDPDKNNVKVAWWQYNDAGTYPGDVTFSDAAAVATDVRIPDDAQPGQLIHVILEATDDGTPRLTRYQRVIIRVR
jgi:hypothetical protein